MLKIRPKSDASKRGFTIVELLIIAPIVILTIGAFITVIVSMTGEVLASRSSNSLAYSIQNALNRIESDAKSSTTFLEASNITLTSPQGYDDATGSFANVGDNGNMLIMNTFTTTDNPASATSGLVYLTGQPNNCTSPQQNTPMMMNVIYFVKNSQLWRRSIMTPDYLTAGCTTPWQQPSCTTPAGFCKTQDELMVDGINASDFVVQYFATSGATTADSVASDTLATPTARHDALKADSTVGVSIGVTKTTAGRDIAQSGTIRATGDGGIPVLPPTGGTISYSGGYTIHTFTTSGAFTINSGSASIQYLVVGGGGGGGTTGNDGGGGGAGGYRSSVNSEMSGGGASAESPLVLSAGSYTVTVGNGGNAGASGGNSVFYTITSLGGGYGCAVTAGAFAAVGGSGGGGATTGSATGAAGTAGQGYLGGNYVTDAGGGGGAGGPGIAGNVSPYGKGGVGVSSSIDGTPTYRGGGGGGGTDTVGRGLGGNGGGGGGSTTTPTAGTANTGGGGGGSGGTYSGAAGGSGIVIIRYLTP